MVGANPAEVDKRLLMREQPFATPLPPGVCPMLGEEKRRRSSGVRRTATVQGKRASKMQLRFPWICLLAVWGIAVTAGCLILQAYAASPGAAVQPLRTWPEPTVIPLDARRPTLLMFLHPLCPCSGASVDELSEILARSGDRVAAHVVVMWTESKSPEAGPRIDGSLSQFPGLTTWDDKRGALARRFGVRTSGHVVLYDAQGRLLYSGGITPARGHRGDNYGRNAVLAEIFGKGADRCRAPAFGCPLFDPGPEPPAEARP